MPSVRDEHRHPMEDEIEAQAAEDQCTGLPLIAREMEQALLDLQGPLDTLELLADTLDLREATAIGWLVRTASSSVTRLKTQWENLHEAVGVDDQPRS
jgi:hypothetical protein